MKPNQADDYFDVDNDSDNDPYLPGPSQPAVAVMPWEQLPEETGAAFLAFAVYRDCGPGRTVDGSYRRVMGREGETKGPGAPRAWRHWNKSNRWRERARALDAHNEKVAQASKENIIAQNAAEHQRRIEEQRCREGELVTALHKRAMMLLADPKASATLGDGIRAASEAIKLGRLAVGMAPDALPDEIETTIRFRPVIVRDEDDENMIFR